MNELEKVQNINIPVAKVWKGRRVVTFKDIDAVHQRPSGTAKRNFNKNKKHFIENEDYFKISPYEFRTAFDIDMDERQQNEIMLFTEVGYLMLVKSFRDDLSWSVQRQLVNGYFKGQELKKQLQQPQEPQRSQLPAKNPWLVDMEDNFRFLCNAYGYDRKKLYHRILEDINKTYKVDEYKILYKHQVGHAAEYVMEVVAFFPELREEAEKTIFLHIKKKQTTA